MWKRKTIMQHGKEYARESIMQLNNKENIMYKQTLFTPSAKS